MVSSGFFAMAGVMIGLAHALSLQSTTTWQQGKLPLNRSGLPLCAKTRVFDVGLPRTGTQSLCTYGSLLGYKATHVQHAPPSDLHSCVADASTCTKLFDAADPNTPDIFCDMPVPGIGCQLASAFPDARFILMKRTFELYYPSARYWLCNWGAPDVCNQRGSQQDVAFAKDSHIELYGKAYQNFCDIVENRSSEQALCGNDLGKDEDKIWDEFGLTELIKDMQDNHDKLVQKCIPAERLLVVDLASTDDEKVEQIGTFLGCAGEMPDYPHDHKISG